MSNKTGKFVRFYNQLPTEPYQPPVMFKVNNKLDAQHALWRCNKKGGYYNEFSPTGKRIVNDFITPVKPPGK